MEWKPEKPAKKGELSIPKDKSLEAYKAWVTEIAKRLTKTDFKLTEQEWIESWKEFWQRKPRG